VTKHMPTTPSHLKDDGCQFFQRMCLEYQVEDCGGLSLLERAAECVDRLVAARAAIAEHGEVITTAGGKPVLNPACKLEKEARDGFLAAMRMLNLDTEPPRPRPGRPAKIGGYA
jgi:hypothetical protein